MNNAKLEAWIEIRVVLAHQKSPLFSKTDYDWCVTSACLRSFSPETKYTVEWYLFPRRNDVTWWFWRKSLSFCGILNPGQGLPLRFCAILLYYPVKELSWNKQVKTTLACKWCVSTHPPFIFAFKNQFLRKIIISNKRQTLFFVPDLTRSLL